MSANTEFALYTYFRSSAAFRVRIALNLKRLKAEQCFVNLLHGEQNSERYHALNPQDVVPTLVHGGAAIGQSLAIIEYIDEIAPDPPLLPDDSLSRARVRQMALTIACEIHPLCNLRVRRYLAQSMSDDALAGWQCHWIGQGLTAVEALVTGGRFAYGNRPTLADVFIVPQLYNARRAGLDLSLYPKLVRIEEGAYELTAFRDAHPDNQPDAA